MSTKKPKAAASAARAGAVTMSLPKVEKAGGMQSHVVKYVENHPDESVESLVRVCALRAAPRGVVLVAQSGGGTGRSRRRCTLTLRLRGEVAAPRASAVFFSRLWRPVTHGIGVCVVARASRPPLPATHSHTPTRRSSRT